MLWWEKDKGYGGDRSVRALSLALECCLYLEVADRSGDCGGQQPYQSDANDDAASGSWRTVPATVTYDREVPIESDDSDRANGHHDVGPLQGRHQLTEGGSQGPLSPAKERLL
jgi:hypothetical protein